MVSGKLYSTLFLFIYSFIHFLFIYLFISFFIYFLKIYIQACILERAYFDREVPAEISIPNDPIQIESLNVQSASDISDLDTSNVSEEEKANMKQLKQELFALSKPPPQVHETPLQENIDENE